jgi:hypothetical protein
VLDVDQGANDSEPQSRWVTISPGHSNDRVRHLDRHGGLRHWFRVAVGHRAKEKAEEKSASAKEDMTVHSITSPAAE